MDKVDGKLPPITSPVHLTEQPDHCHSTPSAHKRFFLPPRRQARALAIGQSHRMIDEDPQLIGSNQMLLGPYVVGQRSYGTPFWVSIALF